MKYDEAGAEITLVSGRSAWAEYACPLRFVLVLLPLVMLITSSPLRGFLVFNLVTQHLPCVSAMSRSNFEQDPNSERVIVKTKRGVCPIVIIGDGMKKGTGQLASSLGVIRLSLL